MSDKDEIKAEIREVLDAAWPMIAKTIEEALRDACDRLTDSFCSILEREREEQEELLREKEESIEKEVQGAIKERAYLAFKRLHGSSVDDLDPVSRREFEDIMDAKT